MGGLCSRWLKRPRISLVPIYRESVISVGVFTWTVTGVWWSGFWSILSLFLRNSNMLAGVLWKKLGYCCMYTSYPGFWPLPTTFTGPASAKWCNRNTSNGSWPIEVCSIQVTATAMSDFSVPCKRHMPNMIKTGISLIAGILMSL